MKVLNLYAGIGGNRKLWTKENTGVDIEVTAVELDEKIAKIYQDFFPNDKVIVADAYQYLLEHYKEFDFIWSSPPCPTHSRFRLLWKGDGSKTNKNTGQSIKYPDMKLYQEIIFLDHFSTGKFVIENVISYYQPLYRPIEAGSHYFWTNFYFTPIKNVSRRIRQNVEKKEVIFDLKKYNLPKRKERTLLNNCVHPELGLHIFNSMNNQELKLAI